MIKLGIAPIGWTNDDMPELGGEITFEQCISEMALAGYAGCEVGTKYPVHDKQLLKHMLDIRGITICNQWFSYEFSTKPFQEVKENFINHIDFLNYFNAKVVGGAECGNTLHGQYHTPLSYRKEASKEDWKKLTSGLNELGRISLEEYGIKLAYHHHMATMVETQSEADRLLNETDDKYVTLNYDCGHFYFAGEDPVAMLQKYISRTSHIHFKDVRHSVRERVRKDDLSFLKAVKLGIYTVPGDGDLDMHALADIVHKSNYEGWLVVEAEQDPSVANPYEYSKKGYEFLTNQLKF
ncbi:myo-inosose-2 dehydratase [Flavivirga jejuensis]|uniref:Myo-inosose-2 dehydratase n=1 Tax=Flavivirga jejuensis TaxID=870487 RepID=A0ABT8WJ88_9FLAO|nr:myo-inosose-2 dehydratase [Flavivirga jejuensis]MDO5973148.1 myo-inosose-2 dehydratase [Flavivirga jejuensis]